MHSTNHGHGQHRSQARAAPNHGNGQHPTTGMGGPRGKGHWAMGGPKANPYQKTGQTVTPSSDRRTCWSHQVNGQLYPEGQCSWPKGNWPSPLPAALLQSYCFLSTTLAIKLDEVLLTKAAAETGRAPREM